MCNALALCTNPRALYGQMFTAKRQPTTSLLVPASQPGHHDRARRPAISRVALQFAAKPKAANPQSDAEQRSDEAAIHAAAGILTSINKANAECDAQAISALYAEDATVILSDGLLSGRAAIEEAYAQFYERSSSHPSKLEHVVAIGDDMMLRAGSWSHTLSGAGRPRSSKGFLDNDRCASRHHMANPHRDEFYTFPIIGAGSQVAVGAAAEPSGCLPRRSNSRPKQTGPC